MGSTRGTISRTLWVWSFIAEQPTDGLMIWPILWHTAEFALVNVYKYHLPPAVPTFYPIGPFFRIDAMKIFYKDGNNRCTAISCFVFKLFFSSFPRNADFDAIIGRVSLCCTLDKIQILFLWTWKHLVNPSNIPILLWLGKLECERSVNGILSCCVNIRLFTNDTSECHDNLRHQHLLT